MEIAAVDLGPSRPLLAADLTAPLLDMLGGMPANDNVMNFLQPYGSADTRPRLELLEPHRPGRVPVVFIHGLGSDEGTWFDLLNELRVRPWFLKRFEPWLFHYPTGASFLQTSAELRRQLTATVRRFDPEGKDPAMQHLILVGHSMGGLHAKLQVVEPGTALWDSIACVPFNEVRMRSSIRRQVAPGYFFKPLPFVNRVVYIATPHAGSSLASLAVGRVASATVQQPEESLAIHREVLGGNPGAFYSDYVRAPPTTVDILEPKSRILQALHGLRPSCRVTMHSIIGNGITWPLSGPGDNVVPVTSARLPGVDQRQPDVADRARRRRLRRARARRAGQSGPARRGLHHAGCRLHRRQCARRRHVERPAVDDRLLNRPAAGAVRGRDRGHRGPSGSPYRDFVSGAQTPSFASVSSAQALGASGKPRRARLST
jgi:hypothetical protein